MRRKAPYYRTVDQLFSKMIRVRDERCVTCGSTERLQCAHGISRRYRATRWDERNSWAQCARCHAFYTHNPLEWDSWLQLRWGSDLYAEMKQLAMSGRRIDRTEQEQLAAEFRATLKRWGVPA